jgi:hypothetical protein
MVFDCSRSDCKKIRDDEDRWDVIESYLTEHSNVDFSHGICPIAWKLTIPAQSTTDG